MGLFRTILRLTKKNDLTRTDLSNWVGLGRLQMSSFSQMFAFWFLRTKPSNPFTENYDLWFLAAKSNVPLNLQIPFYRTLLLVVLEVKTSVLYNMLHDSLNTYPKFGSGVG